MKDIPSDIKNDAQPNPDSPPPEAETKDEARQEQAAVSNPETSAPASQSVDNISSIQGNPQIEAEVGYRRYKENEDLIEDLKKIQDEPKPPWVSDEQRAQIDAELEASKNALEQKNIQEAENKIEFLYQNEPKFKKCIDLLRREMPGDVEEQLDVLQSSPEPATFNICQEDQYVYRYWGGEAIKKSNWVSPDFDNHFPYFSRDDKKINKGNTMEYVTTYRLKKGARYFESSTGKANGDQYYVPNIDDLIEVKTIHANKNDGEEPDLPEKK